jgi:hypothetical protein
MHRCKENEQRRTRERERERGKEGERETEQGKKVRENNGCVYCVFLCVSDDTDAGPVFDGGAIPLGETRGIFFGKPESTIALNQK